LKRLKTIGLAYNRLDRKGNAALQKFNILHDFNKLYKSGRMSEVGDLVNGDMAVEVLLQFPHVSKLKALDLSESNLTDRSAVAIANSDKLNGLRALNLSGNRITDLGASALADSQILARLKKLNLNFNSIGDAGARAIAESSNLANLESLKLGQNRVGLDGAKALQESRVLRNLMYPVFGFY